MRTSDKDDVKEMTIKRYEIAKKIEVHQRVLEVIGARITESEVTTPFLRGRSALSGRGFMLVHCGPEREGYEGKFFGGHHWQPNAEIGGKKGGTRRQGAGLFNALYLHRSVQ